MRVGLGRIVGAQDGSGAAEKVSSSAPQTLSWGMIHRKYTGSRQE
ncbi:hypothetical protein [Sphingomonas phyllosphaerae]|nr:hypothetical protein [Sphingomonas phyllosphaerae]